MRAHMLAILFLCAMPCRASAWPDDGAWQALHVPGLAEPAGDGVDGLTGARASGALDLVSDPSLGADVASWFADDGTVYLRMRLDEAPWFLLGSSLVDGTWLWGIDADGDPGTFEFAVVLGGGGADLALLANVDGDDIVEDLRWSDADPLASGQLRIQDAASSIDGEPDTLVDVAVPRAALSAAMGAALEVPWTFVVATGDLGSRGPFLVDVLDAAGAIVELDADADGATGPQEALLGSDPFDADSDDDGVSDGDEQVAGSSPTMCDTDADGIGDGVELGVTAPGAGTLVATGCFVADVDPSTTTDPTASDSDGGGLADAQEDPDQDGARGAWETDPNDPVDDVDLDGDGIADSLEARCGTGDDVDADGVPDAEEGLRDTDADGFPDLCDADDDGDGLATLDEGSADSDGDGLIDALDDDSDDDGILDVEEGLGDVDCDGARDAQDALALDGPCADMDADGVVNADEFACGSDATAADSDGDGLSDGEEGCADSDDADCDQLPDRLDALAGDACEASPSPQVRGDACATDDGFLDCGAYAGGACATTRGSASAMLGVAGLLGVLLRRSRGGRRSVGGGLLAILVAMLPGRARAADDAFDAQRFLPAPEGVRTVGVDDAQMPAAGLGASLVTGWARDPLVYRQDSGAEEALVADLVTTDVLATVARGPVRLALDLPVHASWGSALVDDGARLGDARVDLRGQLHDGGDGISVAVAGDVRVPTGDAEAWLGETSPHGGVRAIVGFGGVTALSTSVGARFSESTRLPPGAAWGPRATWGLAASRSLGERARLVAEFDGEVGLDGGANTAPAEARLGLTARPLGSPLLLALAAGAGLNAGLGAPDARVVARVGWSPMATRSPVPATAPHALTRLDVTVVDADGTPLDAVLRLRAPAGAVQAASRPRVGARRDRAGGRVELTGPDGHVTLEVRPGAHAVSAWAEGYQPARLNVLTEVGTTTPLRLTLQPSRVQVTAERVDIRDKVFFAFDSATIQAESFPILDDVAAALENHEELRRIEVQGHTDDVGDDAYNRDLSQRRAEAVRDYLVGQGVDAGRLVAKGYGEDRPLQPGASDEARDANRRVAFVIVAREGAPAAAGAAAR